MGGKPVEILIVEDNYSFALELEMLLKELGYHNISHLENGEKALQRILTLPPDLIILDMHLKGKLLGIEVAEAVAHLSIPILFISVAGEALYNRTQQLPNSIGYLVKPVHPITLRSAIELALSGLEKDSLKVAKREITSPFILLKQEQTYYKVGLTDIVYAQSDGNYVWVYTLSERFFIRSTFKEFLATLPPRDFLQVHRQYVIGLRHFRSANFVDAIVHVGAFDVPLGKQYRESLNAFLGI
jgi:DNA-binding LytR/AlgR family response regulator